MSVTDGLRSAERAVSELPPAPVTNDNERQSIRSFCELHIRKKALSNTQYEQRKEIRQKMNNHRKTIMDYMQRNNIDTMMFTKEDYDSLEQRTAQHDLPMIPLYTRLLRNNKDSNITSNAIEESLDSVTMEDVQTVMEAGKTFDKALEHCIVAAVRQQVTSQTINLRLSESRDRTKNVYETSIVPAELVTPLFEIHQAQHKLKENVNKEEISSITKEINTTKARVEQFFERTGVLSQKVVLDGTTYRIARRILIKHQKINIPKIESWLPECLDGITSLNQYRERMPTIRDRLIKQIQSLPPVTRSEVLFQNIRQKNKN
jgi:hypothetical protein